MRNGREREYMFDTLAERYDRWYDKPFGKTAFKLEKECLELLCEDLEGPFLEVGVSTGRFAVALNIKYGIDKSIKVLRFAKERGVEAIKGEGENLRGVCPPRVVDESRCISCGKCQAICPDFAIFLAEKAV